MPDSKVEVEIVLPVSRRAGGLRSCVGWGLGCLGEGPIRLPAERAYQKREGNEPKRVHDAELVDRPPASHHFEGPGFTHPRAKRIGHWCSAPRHASSVGWFPGRTFHLWRTNFQRKIKARSILHTGLVILSFTFVI